KSICARDWIRSYGVSWLRGLAVSDNARFETSRLRYPETALPLFCAIGLRLSRNLPLRSQRRGVVVIPHHLPPALGFHLLEDATGVAGRNPTVSSTLRTATAKRDAFPAVRTDDDQRVRE